MGSRRLRSGTLVVAVIVMMVVAVGGLSWWTIIRDDDDASNALERFRELYESFRCPTPEPPDALADAPDALGEPVLLESLGLSIRIPERYTLPPAAEGRDRLIRIGSDAQWLDIEVYPVGWMFRDPLSPRGLGRPGEELTSPPGGSTSSRPGALAAAEEERMLPLLLSPAGFDVEEVAAPVAIDDGTGYLTRMIGPCGSLGASYRQAAFIDLLDGRVVAIRATGDLSEVSRERQRATFDAVLDSIEFAP